MPWEICDRNRNKNGNCFREPIDKINGSILESQIDSSWLNDFQTDQTDQSWLLRFSSVLSSFRLAAEPMVLTCGPLLFCVELVSPFLCWWPFPIWSDTSGKPMKNELLTVQEAATVVGVSKHPWCGWHILMFSTSSCWWLATKCWGKNCLSRRGSLLMGVHYGSFTTKFALVRILRDDIPNGPKWIESN